jgi:hypothetical protein
MIFEISRLQLYDIWNIEVKFNFLISMVFFRYSGYLHQ